VSEERVLVVDDEVDYRDLMQAHLRRRGYQVETANNGVEAMELLEEGHEYEVLVVDLMMPEMDGLELLRRAKDHDPDVEVVVISGVGTLESAISSMRMGGAFDYLPKPLDTISDLSVAVERAADYRRLRVERAELQEQVAAERERLQAVIEGTRDALIAADPDDTIALSNPAADEVFGESLIGRSALRALPLPVATLIENWRAFSGDRPTVTEVNWPVGKAHLVSLTPVGGEETASPGWVMLMRDITDLRSLQQMKMRLLAQAADGLREPLAGAFAALLELNELPEQSDERFTGAVEQGIDQLGAIRTWADELMALVALESGDLPSEERVDLLGLLKDWYEAPSEPLLEEKSLELKLDVEEGGPLDVQAEPARKLIEHLVHQAAWRTEAGGQILVRMESKERQHWLTVADQGPTLLDEVRPWPFEHFLGVAQGALDGIGLSLAMIKSAADSLGGQLWVWSGTESGNTLAVSFPRPGPD
jgi:two-component system phosphate regulon sensor histidine kinase PhoR